MVPFVQIFKLQMVVFGWHTDTLLLHWHMQIRFFFVFPPPRFYTARNAIVIVFKMKMNTFLFDMQTLNILPQWRIFIRNVRWFLGRSLWQNKLLKNKNRCVWCKFDVCRARGKMARNPCVISIYQWYVRNGNECNLHSHTRIWVNWKREKYVNSHKVRFIQKLYSNTWTGWSTISNTHCFMAWLWLQCTENVRFHCWLKIEFYIHTKSITHFVITLAAQAAFFPTALIYGAALVYTNTNAYFCVAHTNWKLTLTHKTFL